jgi:Rrf2 family transcriptional regulator, iron-sulfur cluster assembly transcription factor
VKVASRTRSCLRFLIYLAREGVSGEPVSLAQVSEGTGISRRYLEQLAIPLKTAGLIRGFSGRKGGYLLAHDADDITVHDMVVASSGPINFAECAGDPGLCIRHEFCECRPLWVLANHEIERMLASYTLGDLSDEKRVAHLRDRAAAVQQPGSAAATE